MKNSKPFIQKYTQFLRPIAGVFALLVLVLFGLRIADANGSGTLVREETVAPYHVKVGITPFPAQTGTTIMSISLEDTAGGPVYEGNIVGLARGPLDSPQGELTMNFGSDPWDPIHHHASVELAEPGTWTFDIRITGPLGDAEFNLPIEFVPPIRPDSESELPVVPMVIFGSVILLSIVLGVAGRIVWSRRT